MEVDGQWSYYGADGAKAFWWTKVHETWNQLDRRAGRVCTGWLRDRDYRYYLPVSRATVTGIHWGDVETLRIRYPEPPAD